MTTNIGVLVSGRGSNLQSIIDHVESGYLKDIKLSVVISDVKDAFALERAKMYGINAVFIDPHAYESKMGFEEKIIATLKDYNVDLVLLAGYMRILGSEVIRAYRDRIMNIHPALLPSFKGLHGPRQALEYGVKVAGCTVHFVDEGVDSGPIILQSCVSVKDNDTESTLASRILEQEHRIFPEAIKLFTEGKLKVDGRIVLRREN
ncbi:phosphoribosylglycinamide formyltransferase, formyltetrahydrofolate-dependent [Methanomethylovorans hollandica DSM 15978]|uniref:phosphoribosylglycinamide formyltransferase 1 n=1 Tax=Methanomethylovorans hollandica (strain DSM 15978 / NBRC 107637 / DMS1) TaxID=867904 RepID=L0L2G2_METHD|nr:phosphoribosylglycinamide formyltransferase [Methanomethylovorans hollandica]AGB50479.1 phosphoribosylglycinamide formyltransferase, formyltetrahydrofolate-dependent [Methanomethylovorans hollandica DSM 15978]